MRFTEEGRPLCEVRRLAQCSQGARKEAIRQNLSSLSCFFYFFTVLTLMCSGQATEVKMCKLIDDCMRIGPGSRHYGVICRFYHVNFTTTIRFASLAPKQPQIFATTLRSFMVVIHALKLEIPMRIFITEAEYVLPETRSADSTISHLTR